MIYMVTSASIAVAVQKSVQHCINTKKKSQGTEHNVISDKTDGGFTLIFMAVKHLSAVCARMYMCVCVLYWLTLYSVSFTYTS